MGWVKIGNRSFNVSEVEKLTEKEFIEAFKAHYRNVGYGRIYNIKADYKELKKSFTKKKAKKIEIEKESD